MFEFVSSLTQNIIVGTLALVSSANAIVTPTPFLQNKVIDPNPSIVIEKQVASTITPTSKSITNFDNNNDRYAIRGTYKVYGDRTVAYQVFVPKNGGEIKGEFSDFCKGTVRGNYDKSNDDFVMGELDGICSIGIIKQDVKGKFSGKFYDKQRFVHLDWSSTSPINGSGIVDLHLEDQ